MLNLVPHAFRLVVTGLTVIALAITPTVSGAAPARHLVMTASQLESFWATSARTSALARYGKTSAELTQKVLSKGVSLTTGAAANDVFQSAIIMYASAAANLTRERMEQAHLLNGYEPKYEDVKKIALESAEDLLCSSSADKAGISGEILCSGEFWNGVLGGFFTRITVAPLVTTFIQSLLKQAKSRALLIQLIGTMVASLVIVTGFTMSGRLWTDASELAITNKDGSTDPRKKAMAHNLYGRAMHHWLVVHDWNTYIKSEEGNLAAEIFQNMNNILIWDSSLRAAWEYNAWRFGLARGEAVVNLMTLAATLSAGGWVGSSVGGAIAAAWGIESSAPAVIASFLVATGFGIGVSYLQAQFPQLEIGGKITEAIQDLRAWTNQQDHWTAQIDLQAIAQNFDLEADPAKKYRKSPSSSEMGVDRRYAFPHSLVQLRTTRQNWATVAIEKYYELSQKVDYAQATLDMVHEVITNSKFRDTITVKENGKLMTLAEARRRNCAPNTSCDFPLSYQLEKLATTQAIIDQGSKVLTQLADRILSAYERDEQILTEIREFPTIVFPMEMSDMKASLRDEAEIVDVVRQVFTFNFASRHESIRQTRSVIFENEAVRRNTALRGKDSLANLYVKCMNDQLMYDQALALVGDTPPLESSAD